MRRSNTLVFDEHIHSTNNPAISSQELNSKLGGCDKIAIQAEVDNVVGGGNFTVQIFHSSDGRNWLPKNAAAEITGNALATGGIMHAFGYDAGTKPSLGMVQLQVTLPPSTSAHVKLHVTCRDWGGR